MPPIISLRNSTLRSSSSSSSSSASASSASSSSASASSASSASPSTMQHLERKKRLWNSHSQFHPTPNANNDDDDWLQSSLKRVRISTCPGELRLDRDIQQWMMQQQQQDSHTNNHWMTKVSLERNHALGLIVHIDGMARIQLQFPRLYPHVSPWICSMEGATLNTTNVPFITTTHYQAADATTTTTWSPIMTLCDYIPILLQNISLKTTTTTATTSTNTIPTCMSIEETSIPSKHLLFSPNRFNHGYNYTNDKDENSDHSSSSAITYKSSFPSRTLYDTTRLDNNYHDDSSSSCSSQDMEL